MDLKNIILFGSKTHIIEKRMHDTCEVEILLILRIYFRIKREVSMRVGRYYCGGRISNLSDYLFLC